jgi:excisionase family DNA binding protein
MIPQESFGRHDHVGPSPLLEADDVARYTGMTADWVYREVRARRMPHTRLGRYVRFRRESIDAWLLERERGPAAIRAIDALTVADGADMAWGSDSDTASSSASPMRNRSR